MGTRHSPQMSCSLVHHRRDLATNCADKSAIWADRHVQRIKRVTLYAPFPPSSPAHAPSVYVPVMVIRSLENWVSNSVVELAADVYCRTFNNDDMKRCMERLFLSRAQRSPWCHSLLRKSHPHKSLQRAIVHESTMYHYQVCTYLYSYRRFYFPARQCYC